MRKREVRVEGDVAYVPLTRGYEAIIDASDVHLVEDLNWCVHLSSAGHDLRYALTNTKQDGKQVQKLLHRVILNVNGKVKVDHKDGDGLNNRRCNLRIATHTENMQNRRSNKKNASGYKGVYKHSRSERWYAQIQSNKKRHYLGEFSTPEEAYEAYCIASEELHKEFSKTK